MVVEALADYLRHHNANTHWRYPTSEETDAALAAARQTVADLLHCGADEVSFGANMTTITFHLGRALARRWGPGDEIVITELDHHANQDTWRAAAADRGLTVRAVQVRSGAARARLGRLRAADHAADEARRHRRGVERRRHDQRRRAGGGAGQVGAAR